MDIRRHQGPEVSEIDLSRYQSQEDYRGKLRRLLWSAVSMTFFSCSWGRAFRWRRFLLRCFGARLGSTAYIYRTVRIRDPKYLSVGEHASIGPDVDIYNVDRVDIGNHCTISMQAMLCTGSHDIQDRFMALTHEPITIEDGAWVCARAFVGPGVVIGQGAVVAACAVVSKDVAAWNVVVGNPAMVKKTRTIEKNQ
jgi:putative colanic acid biosynthesis acetyltransferase WcaF